MLNLVVFILCAGEQRRWPPGVIKQTLSVDGEPLIERTIRQVRNLYQVEPFVVVRSDHPFGLGMKYFYPDSYKYIFDTLQATSGQWGKTNIILLGDVYYSQNALMTIYSGEQFAYGNFDEIFGVKFQRGEIVRLVRAIATARNDADAGGTGRLWNVYRVWDGFGVREHKHGQAYCFLPKDDETQDFDTPESYQKFEMRHSKVAA